MAVSQRVQLLSNKSDEISIITQFLTDPNLVKSLEDEVRRLNKLTEEEEARLHESKCTIQNIDQLKMDFQKLRAEMTTEKEIHDKKLADQKASLETEVMQARARIAADQAALDERAKVLAAEDVRLRQYDNRLREKAAAVNGIISE